MQADSKKDAGYRAAKLAVIILTTLLVLGVVALAFGFMRQYRLYRTASHGAAPHVADTGTPAAAIVTLAPGAHIVSAGTDAGKLILQIATPGGGEVEIIDLATGRLTAQVRTAPK